VLGDQHRNLRHLVGVGDRSRQRTRLDGRAHLVAGQSARRSYDAAAVVAHALVVLDADEVVGPGQLEPGDVGLGTLAVAHRRIVSHGHVVDNGHA